LKKAATNLPNLDPKLLYLYSEFALKEEIKTISTPTKNLPSSHDLN
jgi:hypothetical protein